MKVRKTAYPKDRKLELLTDKNSALVLVDYQPAMFAGVASGDKTINCTPWALRCTGVLEHARGNYRGIPA